MVLFPKFEIVHLEDELKHEAIHHAQQRTEKIIRQFVPKNAPLTALESNYVGCIGEIAVRKFLNLTTRLDSNYNDHKVDDGDVNYKDLVYDIKTDAIPVLTYNKLYTGIIKDYETYGCRVFSAKHLHHLVKYTGGVIFAAFSIPEHSRENKPDIKPDQDKLNIRTTILENNEVLIVGYVEQNKIADRPPTWFTPMNPYTGKQSQYYSPNYIFHHDHLQSIRQL